MRSAPYRILLSLSLVLGLGAFGRLPVAGTAAEPGGVRSPAPPVAAAADTDTVARPARDTARPPPAAVRGARPDTVDRRVPTGRDTLEGDSMRADSTRADSTRADSLRRELESRRQALSAEGYPTRDSVFQRLLGLPDYRPVEYRGVEVLLEVPGEEVRLRGEAQTNYTTSVLEADSILYRAGLQLMRAGGHIRLLGEGREVTSDSVLYYDISRLKGTIMNARTVFAEGGAQWYVRGTATPKGSNTVYVQAGSFTTCELEEPHYYFQAGKIKVVSQNYIVAWPVVLYIHGIPVAWLPFFAQDIRPGRRSGFLPPVFGFNDIVQTGDTRRSVSDFGYYFALSRFADARFTVDWLSGRYTTLNGLLRYRLLKSFLSGSLYTGYSFGDDGRNLNLRAQHRQQLTPNTDFNLNLNYTRNTRLFENRTFDPRDQTQTINTDVGFNHRFSFATMQFSGRRQQFLGEQTGNTTLTLPSLRMSFVPVTLFRAPLSRAGPFNNLVLTGGFNVDRVEQRFRTRDNTTTTRASASQGIRLGRFTVDGSANFTDLRTIPFDSIMEPPPPFSRSTLLWQTRTGYQVDLMGSTTLRPNVLVSGGQFQSPDTGGEYIATPTRVDVGATLSTDLYAFLPGFGPFSRIRHKISPVFSYSYSPAVTVPDSLLQIPGFPGGSRNQRNILRVDLRQTFEAKLRPRAPEREEGAESEPGAAGAEREEVTGEQAREAGGEAGEAEGEAEEADRSERAGAAAGPGRPQEGAPPVGRGMPAGRGDRQAISGSRLRSAQPERKITLLAINSSSLVFDFAAKNQPVLTTDRWRHAVTTDLLRGFSFNVTLDLFEGLGEERNFKPMLAEVTGAFSINSRAGIGGLFGGGDSGPVRRGGVGGFGGAPLDSRYRGGVFGADPFRRDRFNEEAAGPWDLSITYSLQRVRPEEFGEGRQSVGGILRFQPTPNWRVRWQTQYNVKDREFESNLVSLERDLHRWEASFGFARLPNGNTTFRVMVNLKDAPDLRIDFDQQTQRRR